MLYQFLPRLSDDEYSALETSIRVHGIQVPIVVDEDRAVIDGHHRKEIADRLGLECPRRFAMDLTDEQKRTLALSLNLDRRHLNREQKRELVEKSIKADPHLSNRQHAERTGVSPTTVGASRTRLEHLGDVSSLDTRTDSLGRQQPARVEPPAAVNPVTGEVSDDYLSDATTGQEVTPSTGFSALDQRAGEVEEPGEEVEPSPHVTPSRPVVTDDHGKNYTRPEPRKPQRRSLVDDARDAGQELRKAVERLERIRNDDRLPRNKEEVAAHLRHHLDRATQVCQDLDQIIN